MFVSWPARIAAGTTVDEPVAHIDVMPTLAAAAGAGLPEGVVIDGRNLLPLAEGLGSVTREDDAIFWQSGYYRVVRSGNWKLQVDGRQEWAAAVTDAQPVAAQELGLGHVSGARGRGRRARGR